MVVWSGGMYGVSSCVSTLCYVAMGGIWVTRGVTTLEFISYTDSNLEGRVVRR